MDLNNSLNWQRSPLRDVFELAAAMAIPAIINFFETPASTTKSFALTNLTRSKQLLNPEQFLMDGLRLLAVDMSQADIQTLMKRYVLRFYYAGDVLIEGNIDYFPGGGGIVGGGAATTVAATTIQSFTNGVADPRATHVLGIDPNSLLGDMRNLIDHSDQFEVRLEAAASPGNSAAAIFLRCYIDGAHGRKAARG